ncbi:ArpU family transcriptional regulator [Enterococcus rivorum]|uniref:ArpU family transcriptional regulator n=2 Tax=Enterococcus rivorum TaxID=762845 RepID=A0A1E5KYG2_9ENTE|nr:ArpU family transcriptional regulator [Enterococcus rivorum]
MILFPEIDKKKTKKNVSNLLNTYRSLIRIAGSEHSPKITATYFFEMKDCLLQKVNRIETIQNRKKLAESELLKIIDTMNRLDANDRELLYDKFMHATEQTNIAIYMKHHMSESKFYRELDKALIHFAEAYGDGELIIEK